MDEQAEQDAFERFWTEHGRTPDEVEVGYWCHDESCEEGGWWDEESDSYWHEEQPPALTDADEPEWQRHTFANAAHADRSVPVIMHDIAIRLRSLFALLGSDPEKNAVMLAAHEVLDGIIGEYQFDTSTLGMRKAFLDIVEGL